MLTQLIDHLRSFSGILHKQDIQIVSSYGHTSSVAVGDDCAAIPDGEGYLLLAAEGMSPTFVETDPWFAGWCAVMVNISDIAAMGGRAVAVVDTLWSQSLDTTQLIWAGMQAAARTYDIPIVGGHTNQQSPYNALSVAILGRAKRLISSFQARPNDTILIAIDLAGKFHSQYPFWNAATEADPLQLRQKLEILPTLAEVGWCDAGKDISMGGIVGTLLMLLETSGCGAVLQLDQIPCPLGVPLDRWLISFPSYGFLLSVRPDQAAQVQTKFQQQNIVCEPVGRITDSRQLWLEQGSESALFWDLEQTALMGFSTPAARERSSMQECSQPPQSSNMSGLWG